MYIPEFWVGVGATIVTELAMFVVCGIIYTIKENNKKK